MKNLNELNVLKKPTIQQSSNPIIEKSNNLTNQKFFIPQGINTKEFRYMVEAGIPGRRSFTTCNRDQRKTLSHGQGIRTTTTRFFTDIIAVEDNPLVNIKTL